MQALQLDKMTTEEKLCAMEEIWTSLSQSTDKMPSPHWHGEELKAREARLAKGATSFSDWSEAKKRILDQAHG